MKKILFSNKARLIRVNRDSIKNRIQKKMKRANRLESAALVHVQCLVPRINGTSNDGGPACRRNGCANNSAAVARTAGSRTSIRSKKFCSCGETLCRFFRFGGLVSRIRRIACSGGSLKNGGSPSTISMTMMPSDQISTSGPYGSRLITSGLIQYGVPTNLSRKCEPLRLFGMERG